MATLFDIPPKSDPKLLYAREKELHDLVGHLKNRRWVVLLGPRRVGKTSLAKCAIKQFGHDSITLDARENSDFLASLSSTLGSSSSALNISATATVPKLPFLSVGANYSKQIAKQNLDSILKRKSKLIVLLDEAQWFRNPRTFVRLLAHIYDYHYDTVTPIITGSAVGVMKSILDPNNKSPLYGRPMIEMEVKKWVPSSSIGFLSEGLKQNKLSLDEDYKVQTVEILDGIPGWLTMFGYHFTQNPKDYDKALSITLAEAINIVSEETRNISKLARGWPSHLRILENLISGSKTFTELVEATNQNNASLSRHLDILQRLSYVEKNDEDRYIILDPILREFLKEHFGTKISKRVDPAH
ncbi:MAG: ATP-binding protein [archaeon]|nr:ATP-binding protein [archaeon]